MDKFLINQRKGKIEFIFYKHHFKFVNTDINYLKNSICESLSSIADVEIIESDFGFISNSSNLPNVIIKLSNEFPVYSLFSSESQMFEVLCYYLKVFSSNYRNKEQMPLNVYLKFPVYITEKLILINLQMNNDNICKLQNDEKHSYKSIQNFVTDLNEYVNLKSISLKYEEDYPYWSFNIFEGDLKSSNNKVKV
ncbi:MAG TPA: hypothetical protein VFF33_03060 [Ignavibacteriaceae bacterium]|nr:hypothetical protein [Ignavibacteriaceae bacterium]